MFIFQNVWQLKPHIIQVNHLEHLICCFIFIFWCLFHLTNRCYTRWLVHLRRESKFLFRLFCANSLVERTIVYIRFGGWWHICATIIIMLTGRGGGALVLSYCEDTKGLLFVTFLGSSLKLGVNYVSLIPIFPETILWILLCHVCPIWRYFDFANEGNFQELVTKYSIFLRWELDSWCIYYQVNRACVKRWLAR